MAKQTKLSQRKLVTCLLLIAGCSQIAPQNTLDTASIDSLDSQEAIEGNEQSVASIDGETPTLSSNSTKSNSAMILQNTASGISISEELALTQDKYLFKLSSAEPVINVLKLTNPPRLVVDVIGAKKIASQEIRTSEVSNVSNIRIGSHSDKLRLVLDLKNNEALNSQSVESVGNDIVISIPVAEESKTQRLALLSSNLGARAQLAPSGDNDAINEEVPAQPEIGSIGGTDSSLPTLSKNSNSDISLQEVDFTKTANSGGEVVLQLSTPVAFELSQTAPSEYVLLLPGVSPNENVLAPRISTKGKEGIRTVRVVEEDNKTVVRFFVDAGVTLSAIPRDEKILIKPSTSMAGKNGAARGQLADPKKVDDKFAQNNPTGLRSTDGSKVYTGRLISLDLQDTDIDNALRIIAEVSNLNIIASEDVAGKVTLRLIDVPWDQALDVILKTNGLDQVTEGNVIRIAPIDKLRQEREALREAKRAAENLEDLAVQYVRVSYARAEDVKPKVEAVLSERGTVTADDRTNQLIIKDIKTGQKEALDLLRKLDLRTPQVLLETQIVEGNRSLLRDLGFQWNFSHVQSPATGNATGVNFPNTVSLGGGTADTAGSPWAVNFPSVIGTEAGSAITAILDSADGSRMVGARLSALEQEGKARIVSRPQVATINNKQAKISSVTTVRIRTPNAGTSVATGAGASAAGGGGQAFQEFHVGILLEVTPQASPDHYVLMDIDATSSSFSTRPPVDNIPATVDRKATSSILVKSGQTFALGGVYRIEDKDDLAGVPFLKDIPFLGAAFRRSKVENSDEELLFFITPHIVEGSFDASAM